MWYTIRSYVCMHDGGPISSEKIFSAHGDIQYCTIIISFLSMFLWIEVEISYTCTCIHFDIAQSNQDASRISKAVNGMQSFAGSRLVFSCLQFLALIGLSSSHCAKQVLLGRKLSYTLCGCLIIRHLFRNICLNSASK